MRVLPTAAPVSYTHLYQKQHQAEYQLHDTTLQELSGLGIKKLPSQEKLQKQLQQLETELAATQKELTQLQADQRTLHLSLIHIFPSPFSEILSVTSSQASSHPYGST